MNAPTLGAAIVAFAICGLLGKRGAWVAFGIAIAGVFVIHPWSGWSGDTGPNSEEGLAWVFVVIPLWFLLALGAAAGTLLNYHLRSTNHTRR